MYTSSARSLTSVGLSVRLRCPSQCALHRRSTRDDTGYHLDESQVSLFLLCMTCDKLADEFVLQPNEDLALFSSVAGGKGQDDCDQSGQEDPRQPLRRDRASR